MLQMILGYTASVSLAFWKVPSGIFRVLQMTLKTTMRASQEPQSAFTIKPSRLWPMSNSPYLRFGSLLHFTPSSSNIVEPNPQECGRAICRLLTHLVIFIHSFKWQRGGRWYSSIMCCLCVLHRKHICQRFTEMSEA